MASLDWIQSLGIPEVVDILFTATLIYALLLGLRKTKATFVFGGMIFLSAFYIVALTLGLRLTSYLFQIFFTVILMAIIVIFQEEIRAFFERIAVWAFQRKTGNEQAGSLFAPEIEMFVTTLTEFARDKTGALCLVVSEERGMISVARNGTLRQLTHSSALRKELEEFQRELGRGAEKSSWIHGMFLNLRLKASALGVALAMWFLFVHESVTEYRSFFVPVGSTGLREDLNLDRINPSQVRIIVSGPRRAFYFVDSEDFPIVLKLFDFESGTSEATVTASDLSLPKGVDFANVFPRTVQLTIAAKP